MTIKSALSVVALAAGLVAGPAFAQTSMMIGSQTVAEADVAAVQARCVDLQTASETQSLASDTESDAEEAEEATAGEAPANDATIQEVPDTDAETSATVDLNNITLADCEAGGWFDM